MKLAIISDTHDNEENTKKLVDALKKIKVDALVHCGDVCSPFIIKKLAELKIPLHVSLGYSDGNSILTFAETKDLAKYNAICGEVDNIAFIHDPWLARGLASIGKYKAVFYGHTHEAKIEKIKDCWIINPGEITGRKNKPSYAIYDTKTNEVEIKKL